MRHDELVGCVAEMIDILQDQSAELATLLTELERTTVPLPQVHRLSATRARLAGLAARFKRDAPSRASRAEVENRARSPSSPSAGLAAGPARRTAADFDPRRHPEYPSPCREDFDPLAQRE